MSFSQLDRRVGGPGDLVYLDKGGANGVKIGDIAPLQQSISRMVDKEVLNINYSDLLVSGLVKVVDVTDVGSVAYILSSIRPVQPGDKVGFINQDD